MSSSMNIRRVTWDGVTIVGVVDHRATLLGRVEAGGGGASDWQEETTLVEKLWQVEIVTRDANSYKDLMGGSPSRQGGVESELIVESNKTNNTTNFFRYTYDNARLTAPRIDEGHDRHGLYTATFICRSVNGTTPPLVVTEV